MEFESNSVLFKKPKLIESLCPKPGPKLNYEPRFDLQKPNISPKLSKNPKQIPDPTQDLVWCEIFLFIFFATDTN